MNKQHEEEEGVIQLDINILLESIEEAMIQNEMTTGYVHEFTKESFRASIGIFTMAMTFKMLELFDAEKMDKQDKIAMSEKVTEDFYKLIKTYTGLSEKDIYEDD